MIALMSAMKMLSVILSSVATATPFEPSGAQWTRLETKLLTTRFFSVARACVLCWVEILSLPGHRAARKVAGVAGFCG